MVGLIKKVLGGAKSDFFLELDESQESQTETEVKKVDSKPVENPPLEKAVMKKAPEPARQPAEVEGPEAQPKTPSPQAKTSKKAEGPEAQPKTPSPQAKTSKKKSAQPKAAPPATNSGSPSTEELIAAAVDGKTATSSSKATDDKTFAPNYLMPVPTRSRRRPGPSLKMFQEMARQVNGRKG
ncbi:MAG: hypothetical protein SW833_27215 [Cyanobacteriota bacterium]|nr:hypothetical protein [Cyanobacteriota bacterium]